MKYKIGLRSLLILLAFTAVAPGIAVVMYLSTVVQHDEIIRAREELESVNNLVGANQAQLIEGARQILTAIASGPSVRRDDLPQLCSEYLRNIRDAGPIFTNIGWADLDGNVRCQALHIDQPINIRNRDYFKNTAESGSFSAGEYAIGLTSGRKIVGFGLPVVDYASAPKGVAFASIDLDFADRQLKAIPLPKQLRVYVTDSGGHILVSNDMTTDLVGTMVADKALRSAMTIGRTQDFSARDKNAVEWLHVVKPIISSGRHGFMVAVSVRKIDAVAAVKKRFEVQLLLMAVASLVGFLLAWLFAGKAIARPVAQLLERIRRAERGETGPDLYSSSATGSAEFVELNSGLSSMLGKLLNHQQHLQKAQELTRIGFFELDIKSQMYTVVSPIIYQIFGLDPNEGSVPLARYRAMIHPDDVMRVEESRARLFAGEKPLHLEYRLIRPDGALRWLDAFGFVDRDEHGVPTLYSGAIQDITERKVAEERANANENRFQLLFENSLDGILQTTLNGEILAANSAACTIFGVDEEELRRLGRDGVVSSNDPRRAHLLSETEATGNARGELTMVRGDGSLFEAELTTSVYVDGNGSWFTSIILRDITDRIRSEKDIHRLAFFDALTALPNRRLLMDRMTQLLALAQRNGTVGAVLFIDLDHFKNVNDARGHATGDTLLQQVAQRLSALMRSEDTVARIGGDEFVILMPSIAVDLAEGSHHAMLVAEKVLHALTQPFIIDGQPYNSGASIGVSLLPKPGQTTDDLLREADTAMYRAKSAGRKRVAFFHETMQSEVEEHLALENDLIEALGTNQLTMALQPQYDHAGVARGGELLMRWTHPQRGAVGPALFIPIAEESGLILRLGDWVIQEGCRILLQLQQAGLAMPLSINISPRQFRQPNFVSRVKTILAETGAPPSLLIFEVTEGVLIENLDDTIRRMNELVALGIRFSIDDFGTGYSSLAYLRRLPLHELKIDRGFVHGTPADQGNCAIVQMILSMARHLGLRVVAEGVETAEQAAFLHGAGCDIVQGYLLARPMPVDQWIESMSPVRSQ